MKKLFLLLIITLFFSYNLFANTEVSQFEPTFNNTNLFSNLTNSAKIQTEISETNFTLSLFFNNIPLEENSISKDVENNILLLTKDWTLNPFQIRLYGSQSDKEFINIEIIINKFVMVKSISDEDNNQYTSENYMQLIDTTPPNTKTSFKKTGDNIYNYSIELDSNKVYRNLSDIASFKLIWKKEQFLIAGTFISDIYLTFTSN